MFDDRVVGLVMRNALGELLSFDPAFVAEARADSDFLAYEAPTYFGMLCASFTPPV